MPTICHGGGPFTRPGFAGGPRADPYSVGMTGSSPASDASSGPSEAVLNTELPLPGRRSGKVRDVYRLDDGPGGEPAVVIVATDRISAFDVVMPTAVPGKGRILTAVATAWFERIRGEGLIADHLRSTDPADIPGLSAAERAMLAGRVMIGRSCRVIPVECVVRGYLAGSGWLEYQDSGTVCGVACPPGLQRASRLPEPIFTPATKAEEGHDENIDFEQACEIAGRQTMERLRDVSIAIYRLAAADAERAGLILADTKFEFGLALDASGAPTGELLLIDEVLTPDSSRYWPADEWRPGEEPVSFDKQYVRNHLLTLVDAGQWDKQDPGPELPADVVEGTLERYRTCAERLFPGLDLGV